MYDVVVVGAGPAGSRYARQAATGGVDVLVLEQGVVGEPLACSGHVSLDIWEYVPEAAHDRLFQNEIRGANFHVTDEQSPSYPFYKQTAVSNVIDRVALDRVLADAARDAGADVREGYTVTDVEERADGVTVTANGPNGVESFDAKLVAGADGPRSRVRTALGIDPPRELLHGVLGFDPTADHGDFVDVHVSVPGFFAWRIPRGDAGVEYGLATTPGLDVPGRFDRFLSAYDVSVERRCSGMIPVGPPASVTSGRGFLLGDAAGQTKPFTGGGILYGMTAADAAAATIDPDRPETLSAYESAWRAELSTEIRLGHWVRRAYSLPTPVQRFGLWALSGEIGVHMDRPSSFFSRAHLKTLFSR